MKKLILFLILILIVFNANGAKKTPQILWEKKSQSGYFYYSMDQDLSSDNFKFLEIKGLFEAKDVNVVKITPNGDTRSEELEFVDKNMAKTYNNFGDFKLFLFNGKYYIKEFSSSFEFYDSSNKLIFKEKTGSNKIQNAYIDLKKNSIYLDVQNQGKKNTITAYNIDTGAKKYEIVYNLKIKFHRAKLYFDDNRIVIYENGNDLSIYSIDEGKLINKITNFAKDCGTFDLFENKSDKDMYFLSINNFYICFFNLESGRLISSINFAKSLSKVTRLSQISPIKYGSLYFLLIDSNSTNEKAVVCINPNESQVVWIKKLPTLRYLEIFDNDTSIIASDKDFIYCLDKFSGKEVWKSKKISFISGMGFAKKIFFVKSNFGKNLIAFNPIDGSIKWSFELKTTASGFFNVDDKYYIIGDTKNVYKIDLETGNVLWKSEDIKNANDLYFNKEEMKLFVTYNKKRGISQIDIDSGRTRWNLETKYDMVDVVVDGDICYFADKKTIYGVNMGTGEIFINNPIKFAGKIDAIEYLKSKKQFVFFDGFQDIYFYDIVSNKISKKITLETMAEFIELRVIGNYLSIIEINRAIPGYGGTSPGINYLSMVDLNNYELLYTIEIGYHYFTDIKSYPEIYKKTGAYYNFDLMGFYFMFYPRKEFIKENALIIQKYDVFKQYLTCYKLFPNNIPTDDDIKKSEKYFINFYK